MNSHRLKFTIRSGVALGAAALSIGVSPPVGHATSTAAWQTSPAPPVPVGASPGGHTEAGAADVSMGYDPTEYIDLLLPGVRPNYLDLDGRDAYTVLDWLVRYMPDADAVIGALTDSYRCAFETGGWGLRAYLADDRSVAAAVLVISGTMLSLYGGLDIASCMPNADPTDGAATSGPCLRTSQRNHTWPDGWSDDYLIVIAATDAGECELLDAWYGDQGL